MLIKENWACPECGAGSVDGMAVKHAHNCNYCKKRFERMFVEDEKYTENDRRFKPFWASWIAILIISLIILGGIVYILWDVLNMFW